MNQPLKAAVTDGHTHPVYPMFLFVPGLLLVFTLAVGYAGALLNQPHFTFNLWLVSLPLLAPIAGLCSFIGFILNERISGMGRRRLLVFGHLVILALSTYLILNLISAIQAGLFFQAES